MSGEKRIIKGQLFDPAMAEVLYYLGRGEEGVDLDWTSETLFRSDNGFVFVGEGGAASAFAEELEDGRLFPGHWVEVMTTDEVISFAEDHEIDPDFILKYIDIPAL